MKALKRLREQQESDRVGQYYDPFKASHQNDFYKKPDYNIWQELCGEWDSYVKQNLVFNIEDYKPSRPVTTSITYTNGTSANANGNTYSAKSSAYLDVKMDDVRYYDRVLSDAEIKNISNRFSVVDRDLCKQTIDVNKIYGCTASDWVVDEAPNELRKNIGKFKDVELSAADKNELIKNGLSTVSDIKSDYIGAIYNSEAFLKSVIEEVEKINFKFPGTPHESA